MDTQRAIEECSRRMAVVYDETLKLVEKARRCEVKLREIALKPDALPIKNYIDLLIEAEKRKSSDNLAERLVSLNELKELCTLKQSVLSGTFKPFGEYHGYDVGLKELDINHEPTKTGELFEVNGIVNQKCINVLNYLVLKHFPILTWVHGLHYTKTKDKYRPIPYFIFPTRIYTFIILNPLEKQIILPILLPVNSQANAHANIYLNFTPTGETFTTKY